MNNVFDDMEITRVRALIEEGLASGICEEEPEAVIERIITARHARYAKKAKL